MIRATLDVNVLVSGLPASRGVPAELIARWLRREFALVVSEHILAEAAEAWEQPYWARRYSTAQVAEAIALLRERAIVVRPVTTVHGVGEDEEDDLVIATAVGGGAQFGHRGQGIADAPSLWRHRHRLAPAVSRSAGSGARRQALANRRLHQAGG